MEEVRQQSSSTAVNAALTGLTESARTKKQSVSKQRTKDMKVRKPEPYATGKDPDDPTGTSRSTDTWVRSILP